MTVSELRAAREWCESLGVLFTPGLVLAVGLMPNPEQFASVQIADTVRQDLLAASWEVR